MAGLLDLLCQITFLSHFFNLTMFNAGFHVEHHEHPAVHWSDLPG